MRRELLASAQDEFADSLRNAHMPADVPVFVLAEIVGTDDQPHRIKRTLVSDYGKKASCTSTLEIDGVRADQTALAKLGIVLSQPPIAAPILMQHTLGYLFSATKRLTALFTELLKIPGIPETKDPLTCLVCETPAALTPARIDKIREQLKASEDYRKAQAAAQNALRQIETISSNVKQSIAAASPHLFQVSGGKRKTAGFSDERMRALLQPDQLPLVDTWKAALTSLARERRLLRHVILRAAAAAKGYLADLDTLSESKSLKDAVELTATRYTVFKTALDGYTKAEQPLRQALHAGPSMHKAKPLDGRTFLRSARRKMIFALNLSLFEPGRRSKRNLRKRLGKSIKRKSRSLTTSSPDSATRFKIGGNGSGLKSHRFSPA